MTNDAWARLTDSTSKTLAVLKPPPDLTVSDWADQNRRLSSEASSEPCGWRTSRAEYQRGIMEAISDAATETVVIMSSSQVGKTEVVNNCVGYHIDQDPAPSMVVMQRKRQALAANKRSKKFENQRPEALVFSCQSLCRCNVQVNHHRVVLEPPRKSD